MASEFKSTFLALFALILISAACGHNGQAIIRTIHLLSEDCVEIAHMHKGDAAFAVERICNSTDKALDVQLGLQPKGTSDAGE